MTDNRITILASLITVDHLVMEDAQFGDSARCLGCGTSLHPDNTIKGWVPHSVLDCLRIIDSRIIPF